MLKAPASGVKQRELKPELNAGVRGRQRLACSSKFHLRRRNVAVACSLKTSTSNGEPLLTMSPSSDPDFGIIYRERFTIRCYEVGTNRRASIQTIANLLQEVACNQVRTLGFSTDGFATTLSMRKHHLIWVTTRMYIEMEEYPLWGDPVEVVSWFQENNKTGTRRDWLLKDVNSGKLYGRATSTWVMMNQETRRLARISDEVREEFVRYVRQPPRYAFSEDHEAYERIRKLENCTNTVAGLKPRRGDLDMNEHVNNVTYIGWMLESLPSTLESTHDLQSITLDFRRECLQEDSVDSQVEAVESDVEGDRSFLHLVKLHGSGAEINRGRTRWRRRISTNAA